MQYVFLNPDAEAKVARIVAELGRDAEALAREAIGRFVNYDEWFIAEVEKGLVPCSSHPHQVTSLVMSAAEKPQRF